MSALAAFCSASSEAQLIHLVLPESKKGMIYCGDFIAFCNVYINPNLKLSHNGPETAH